MDRIKCLWTHTFIILVSVVAVSASARADTYWQGTTGDWFDPANWGAEMIVIPSGTVPEPGCFALLAAGGLVMLARRRKRQSP